MLPLLLGLVAAGLAAEIVCPAPRSRTLSGADALGSAVLAVTASILAGVGVVLVTARRDRADELPLLPFAIIAAWMAPVAVLDRIETLWAAPASALLSAMTAALLRRTCSATEYSPPARLAAMVAVAICLQSTAVCAATVHTRAATAFFAAGAALLAWFHAASGEEPGSEPGWVRVAVALALATLLVAGSLTPYLDTQRATVTSALRDAAGTFLSELQGGNPRNGDHRRRSYPGLILRPDVHDRVTIVPPPPRREVLDEVRKEQPDSIPFRGAYWFFRAADGVLPADAVESRGDPSSVSFQTDDLSPLSMEARQNFGSLLDLGRCRAIEVVITTSDRMAETVSVEMLVANSGRPGGPRQSLGISPVKSSAAVGEDRTEVLIFRVPAKPAIPRFDEVILRFALRFPRQNRSARIAIRRFRLIRRTY